MKPQRPLVSAFYLPQFHPIPENDLAWGPGFTEWNNVQRARPRFTGHAQPVPPGELGYYDLRSSATRLAQGEMARAHGVDAFCWYHYWFDGRRLLREPLDGMIASRAETMPFFLCWANESWTRNWSGRSGEVLVPQRYSDDDDVAHMRWLLPVMHDPRYVRVDDRPVFVVYQPVDLPDARATTERWRSIARAEGLGELLLLAVSSFRQRIREPRSLGFDGVVEQQPDLNIVRPPWRAAPRFLLSRAGLANRFPRHVRYPYDRLARRATRLVEAHLEDPSKFPTVCTGWDNSPRRDRGATIVTDATPESYAAWLSAAMQSKAPIVFINAWNEWAEGAHLEPDAINGRAFLTATAKAVTS